MAIYDAVEEARQAKAHQARAIREAEEAEKRAQAKREAEGPAGLKAAEAEARRVASEARKVAGHHRAEEAKGKAFVAGLKSKGEGEDS